MLFEDEALVAVDKPAGMLVHRTALRRTSEAAALQIVRERVQQMVYPVHRLDRPTSGVLLFARSREHARALGSQFSSGTVQKTYLAVVRGFTADSDQIDHPLRPARAFGRPDREKQSAHTHVRRLAIGELKAPVRRYRTARYSLVALQPRTGRTHQLRRHMKHRFHPILGDRKYGDDWHGRFFEGALDSDRLLLHHARLELSHPVSGAPLHVDCPVSGVFRRVLERMGWLESAERVHADNPFPW